MSDETGRSSWSSSSVAGHRYRWNADSGTLTAHMDTWLRDMHDGVRSLRKSVGVTSSAALTLALGIGATTVMISLVYHIVFHALPYRDVDRVVVLRIESSDGGVRKERTTFSSDEFRAIRDGNQSFEEMIGWADRSVLYDNGTSTRLFRAVSVTPNAFDFLGVPPLMGRAASVANDPNPPPIFVMNHRLWQDEFGGDPSLLGKAFSLDGESRVLVAVMPARFDAFHADIWIPRRTDELGGVLTLAGRLKPGITVAAASVELDVLAHRLVSARPGPHPPAQFTMTARPLLDTMTGSLQKTLYVLLAAVSLLLLVACSNVANLLLAHATARGREMFIRASLGATRGRLIRQLFIESLFLSALAAIAGSGLAYLGLKMVVALMPPGIIPGETVVRLNGPVLLLSLSVAIVTAVLCSIAPALHVTANDLHARLASSGKGTGDDSRHGNLRAMLVVAEVALSIMLLVGAGLLGRSYLVLTQVNLGFNPTNVLYVRPWFPRAQFDSKEKQNIFTEALLDRMKRLPHITAVAESMLVPPLTFDSSDTIIPGKSHTEPWETRLELCSEGFFETLGVSLVSGRLLSDADVRAARHVVVVNRSFASHYFPGDNPLGKTVRFQVLDRPFLDAPHNAYFEIIGIVEDYKTRTVEWQAAPQAFLPYSIQGFSYRTFLARTTVDPETVLKSIEREIWAINPHVGIRNSGTIEGSLHEYYRQPRFKLVTLGTFAAVSLILVVVGVFSLMSYTISLRRQELGIRMALGADRIEIVRIVLFDGLRLILAGIVVGVAASSALSRFFASEISEVSATDPWTFAIVVAIVFAAGLCACFQPVRRAIQVDPTIALRSE